MPAGALRLRLPPAAAPGALLDALVPAMSPYRALLNFQPDAAPALEVTASNGASQRLAVAAGSTAPLLIAPGLRLEPAATADLLGFLRDRPATVNHIGINLAAAAVAESAWRAFIDAAAAALPAYRLELGTANEVVMALGAETVVELVRDRSGAPSSLHLCIAAGASRAELERTFPAPAGGYKPGDEAFFYSVGLPLGLAVACYADFVFADAPAIDWRAIVAAAGRRLP